MAKREAVRPKPMSPTAGILVDKKTNKKRRYKCGGKIKK